jgi:archaellum component FlaC
MLKKFLSVILIVVAGSAVFAYAKNNNFFQKPCSKPITYSIGNYSNQFNLSQQDFLKDIDKAVSIWEEPLDKNLFEYSPTGKLKINLVYDYRQQATDKLKDLGYTIDNTDSSYKQLKAKYDELSAEYKALKAKLEQDIAAYDSNRKAYEAAVDSWNKRGGAPKNVAQQLNAQRDELNAQAAQINKEKDQVNTLVGDINALASTLNRLGADLNLNVQNYNQIGQTRGSEFEEGLYRSDSSGKAIDIFEYSDENQLIRVLAHELGHSLGMQHIDSNPAAIMYYLNQGKNQTATIEDIAALKQICGLTN